MYIERLDENRIKITVDGDDIKEWNVDLKNFTENTAEAQDLFWCALRQAEREVNFKVNQNSQLMVETMPNGDEGFFLYVSLIEDEAELVSALIKAGKHVKQTEFRTRRRTRSRFAVSIFRFNDFDDLCNAAKEVCELFIGSSRLIKYSGSFYLELTPPDSFAIFEVDNILSEFADKIKQPQIFQGVLNEHGKLMIAHDAVSKIACNF